MSRLYKAICAGVSLSLVVGACTYEKKETLKQDAQSQKIAVTTKPDIQSQEATITTYEIGQLAERAINLTKTLFPHEGVIDIGKNKNNNRYIVINVLEENRVKLFEISLYVGSDSKLEAAINKYLLNHDYKSVADALNKSSLDITRFHDYGCDGLRTNTDDFLTMRDKEGKLKTIKDDELSYLLETANETYKVVLKTTIGALEKELKAREEKMKTN